ncbi:unnamed protein product, partial [Ixodes pacificus]
GVDEGGLGGVDLSYEDLSKNFDANLAEIDMETFRSEDIHAILTLPALYGGDFQSASRGEQCASVSGSFLEALPLDAGDDSNEMSICRDEPLFSPVKECHPVGQGGRPGGAGGALSTDSLDCSSLEDHDLVLTCQANKDNYTIAFQQSGTHFSDDLSDGSRSEQQPSQMARSELSFTTWHRLRSSGVRLQPSDGGKSQSLPNLLRRSAAVAGRGGDGCLPLYSLQASTHGSVGSGDARSVSLLRLFMQSKTGSGGSLSSSRSENSDSETSPRDAATAYHLQSSTEESSGSMDSKSDVGERFLKCKPRVKQIVAEANNNNNNNNSSSDEDTSATTRANDNERLRMLTSESEEETSTSQYFEDSLVEAAQLRTKPQTNARSPIREEEEPFESSGDETMKDSRDLLASSDGGASSEGGGGVVERRNNDVNSPLRRNAKSSGQLLSLGKERIKNVLTSSGYVSRQNSVDQIHRQTFLLSAGGNRRKPPLTAIAGVRHSSTQVPKAQFQRAPTGSTPWTTPRPPLCRGSAALTPRSRRRERAPPKRSIYVCYPNYSLPDLSFLKELAEAEDKPELVLRPTQHRLPCAPDEAAATVAPAAFACVDTAVAPPPVPHRRTHSSEPHWRRPKSCTDFEDLSRRNLSHIQDWDSLSVLLPDDVKAMVSRFRNAAPPNPAPTESQQRGILRKLPDEPRRPRSQCDGTPGAAGSLEVPNRRHSLQDYRRLLKGLPDLDGLLPPCGNLVCSGSWRRNGSRGTRHATAGGTCVSCRAKKAVSFSEDLNVRTSDARAVRSTPYGCSCGGSPMAAFGECHTLESLPVSLAGSLERPNRNMTLLFGGSQEDQHPPHEFGVSPKGLSPSWGLSPLSRSQRELVEQKRGLLDGMLRSAKQVVDCYVTEKESQPYVGAPEPCLTEQSACGRLATECLVPTLRELLSDGLLPHVRGVFGRLPNSLWHLAHSLSQTKEGRKEMQELVEYIGQTDNFCADGEKFSACLLGLLNLGCLDTWFLTLLSSPQILQKHYQTSAAFVALLSHPSLFFLREELACSLRSLSELPFSFSLSFALAAEAQSLKRHPAAPFPARSPCACPPATNYGESPGEDSDDLRTATCQSLVDSSSLEETLDNSSRVLELQRKLKGGASPMDGAKVLYPAMQKSEFQGTEEEVQRFQQLRNHWEQMSHVASGEAASVADSPKPTKITSPTKLPSPTKQMHRVGHQPSGGATKKGASAAEGNRRQLRPRTPDSRTPSPNLPQGGAGPPSSNRQAPQTRRSLIPVHRGWRKGKQGTTADGSK